MPVLPRLLLRSVRIWNWLHISPHYDVRVFGWYASLTAKCITLDTLPRLQLPVRTAHPHQLHLHLVVSVSLWIWFARALISSWVLLYLAGSQILLKVAESTWQLFTVEITVCIQFTIHDNASQWYKSSASPFFFLISFRNNSLPKIHNVSILSFRTNCNETSKHSTSLPHLSHLGSSIYN